MRETATKATIPNASAQTTARNALFVNLEVSRSARPPYTATEAAVCPDG
jgi:hypothetical protein